jgi:hypothetical protein
VLLARGSDLLRAGTTRVLLARSPGMLRPGTGMLLAGGAEDGLRVARAATRDPRRVLPRFLTRQRPAGRLRPARRPRARDALRVLVALRVELVAELVGAGHRASSFPVHSGSVPSARAGALSPRRPVRT